MPLVRNRELRSVLWDRLERLVFGLDRAVHGRRPRCVLYAPGVLGNLPEQVQERYELRKSSW